MLIGKLLLTNLTMEAGKFSVLFVIIPKKRFQNHTAVRPGRSLSPRGVDVVG